MTLLEALVALMILGISATSFLGVFQQSARSARQAATWTRAVAYAESGMEAATLGAAPIDSLAGYTRTVTRHPWRDGLESLDVTVTTPDGVHFTLRRVVAPMAAGAAR